MNQPAKIEVAEETLIKLLILDSFGSFEVHDNIQELMHIKQTWKRDAFVMETWRGGILSIVLDLMGVPKDNTIETNACGVANATGKWPEEAFCRDHFTDKWWTLTENSPATVLQCKQYLEFVRSAVAQLKSEFKND